MSTTCTVEHYRDPHRPRRTLDGHTICAGCENSLGRDLVVLPKLHDDLAHLHGARRHVSDQGKISGVSTGARLPIDVIAADARSDIRATITEWAAYAINQARQANAAGAHNLLALNLASGAGWLHFNRDWCTRQDWAADLVTALRRIRSRAVRLLDPRPRQQFAIPGADGLCVRAVEDQSCPGRMWVTIPLDEEESSLIECDTCCHTYPPTSWLRLGKQVHARRIAA